MSVARRTGAPGKADWLFSRIVRSRGRCEYPGCTSQGPFDTAHVIGRVFSAVRCQEENAWCLCRTHHALVDQWPDEKLALVDKTIGRRRYEELRKMAHDGPPPPKRMFWPGEVDRLMARCAELGIDTKRGAA